MERAGLFLLFSSFFFTSGSGMLTTWTGEIINVYVTASTLMLRRQVMKEIPIDKK